jgi:transcription elongation factor GreA
MSSDPYIVTPEGAERLKTRLKAIRESDRPKNVRDIEEARAHGDLRENAEYHAAKERQGMLDAEMRMIEDKLSRLRVIDPTTLSGTKIVFGAYVELLNLETDEAVAYQIVGEDEADSKLGRISYKAPIARALIGKVVGAEVVFNAPGGARTYEVVTVNFR